MSELTCATCPFDVESDNGKTYCIQDACCENGVKWLEEHDAKVRADAVEEILDLFGCSDEDIYAKELIKEHFAEQIKERKNE